MPSSNHYRTAASAVKYASKYASKASLGLARWATTDDTCSTKFLANLPSVGFADTLSIILVQVVLTILGAVASGFMVFVLVAYVIPAIFFLQQYSTHSHRSCTLSPSGSGCFFLFT